MINVLNVSELEELMYKSKTDGNTYSALGEIIVEGRGLYIENGEILYKK